MKFLYNDEHLKDRRRWLRSHQTIAEKKIWEVLRKQRVNGRRVLRQYSVGPYILDFYCPKARLAVEIDGGHHGSIQGKAYDQERSDFLQAHNITVIRFWNDEVDQQMHDVIEKIEKALDAVPK